MQIFTDKRFKHFSFLCAECDKKGFSPYDLVVLYTDGEDPADIQVIHRICHSELQRRAQRLGLPRFRAATLADLALGLLAFARPGYVELEPPEAA